MSWGVLGLHVEIGGEPALADVDLEVGLGQIAAVVGGDGAGKTTLARVLGRLVSPLAGRLRLPPRRSVGYQPASSGSWPDLTVVENLKFVADSHRMPTAQARSRLDELVAATGLDGA
ncbi:MAG: ATP-binding cassette domain-containing protein, partial [Actinobacteria bacterium]